MAVKRKSNARSGTGGKRSVKKQTVKNTKNLSGKRASSAKAGFSQVQQTESNGMVAYEITLLALLGAAVVMEIGNLGFGGRLGNGAADVLFGIFGILEFVFPFVLFFGFAFFVANRRNRLIGRKMAGLIMVFVCLGSFMELLTYGFSKSRSFMDYYHNSYAEHAGGGIIGGFFVKILATAFGMAGAYIIVLVGLIMSAIILTQKPILTSLSRKGRKAARRARDMHQIRKEERLKRREEAERIRIKEKDAKTFDTDRTSADETEPFMDTIPPVFDMSGLTITGDTGEDASQKETDEASYRTGNSVLSAAGNREKEPDPLSFSMKGLSFKMPAFLGGSENKNSGLFDIEEEAPSFVKPDPLPASGQKKAEKEPETISPDAASSDQETVRAKRASPAEQAQEIASINKEISKNETKKPLYKLPSVDILTKGTDKAVDSRDHLMATAKQLQDTLASFGVNVHVVNVSRGPTVTRYELQPEQGVKVSRIVSLQDDIKLNLAAAEIRIEAPIPGKHAVGIEVPNKEPSSVMLRELLESDQFRNTKARLAFAVGKDISGRPVISDIEKMPHMLIAGATGSGKSVCINTLIVSLLYKYRPDEVKMLMIDPKVVELKIYDGIPHLLIPVVTDPKKAAGALNWAVQEMTERYNKFAETGVRDIKGYNKLAESKRDSTEGKPVKKLPRIIVIVDELADLMMVASKEVEDAICRLAQLARAAGIHLIIATQRPSVNVVTGLIKANMPSRIALAVSSGVDSRTILDMNGAEKLLGKGDMLFYPQGLPKPARVQGAFVSDEDITRLVEFLTAQDHEVLYNKEVEDQITGSISSLSAQDKAAGEERDEYFSESGRLIIEKDKASIGMLQRAFKIGFNRAARIMDQLSEAGIVGPEEGTKPRKILVTMAEFEEILSHT